VREVLKPQDSLLATVEQTRLAAVRRLDPARRGKMGQFMTPAPVARFMASLFRSRRLSLRVLDAGAGVGSLSAAIVAEMCRSTPHRRDLKITAYEIEPLLVRYLKENLDACRAECQRAAIELRWEVIQDDFIEAGVSTLRGSLFGLQQRQEFDLAILNPPYRKINSHSRERRLLRSIGVETSNLYTGFLAVVLKLLRRGGELVAITPRSFCNGPYFKPFRKLLLEEMVLHRVHVFESRDQTFRDDDVLQENVIIHAIKGKGLSRTIVVSSSDSTGDDRMTIHRVTARELVHPGDPEYFIRIAPEESDRIVASQVERLPETLDSLKVSVSTGRVVDFRAKQFLRGESHSDTAPLIYPTHFDKGFVKWPKPGARKPNAILVTPATEDLLVPADTFVLVRRFSAKEERRRVVAAIHDPTRVPGDRVAFENHLNYFHCKGRGLPSRLARGLAIFLNSTLVDRYFRQFSGHTQVNATDLRNLRYPTREQLEAMGASLGTSLPNQEEIDRTIDQALT
jgi:adenine-specific DNA-methyltransferase